jgi:hypothetical protein
MSIFTKARRPVLPILFGSFLLSGVIGCGTTARITPPRSAWEQILSTEAIDRALAQIEWPDLRGKSVMVSLGAPNEGSTSPSDRDYMKRSIQVAVASQGGLVVTELDQAELVLTALVGAMGLDTSGRFLGVRGTSGGFIPITIPELALYKRVRLTGFAKTEIALVDHKTGGVIHRSGPVQGSTHRVAKTYFFVFNTVKTDTSRLD